jgi:hypothetical protein
VIHDALLEADQLQPLPVVIDTLPVVAPAPTDRLVGDRL